MCAAADAAGLCAGGARPSCGDGCGSLPDLRGDAFGCAGGRGGTASSLHDRIDSCARACDARGCAAVALHDVQSTTSFSDLTVLDDAVPARFARDSALSDTLGFNSLPKNPDEATPTRWIVAKLHFHPGRAISSQQGEISESFKPTTILRTNPEDEFMPLFRGVLFKLFAFLVVGCGAAFLFAQSGSNAGTVSGTVQDGIGSSGARCNCFNL